jgi:hypothetical protein
VPEVSSVRSPAPAQVAVAAFVLVALAWNPAARAADRIAVLILAEPGTEVSMADNLTEIAIARIAQRRDTELTGTTEFRRRLGLESNDRALGCLSDLSCLGRVGVALGVRRAFAGTVRAEEGRFLIHLTLTDIESGKVESRFFRLVQGGVKDLIKATQDGTDDLFRPRLEPGHIRVDSNPQRARVTIDDAFVGTTPVLSGALIPGRHLVHVEQANRFPWSSVVEVKAATDLEIKLQPEHLPPRRAWPKYVGFAGVGTALAAAGLGAVLGAMSRLEPTNGTRQALQEDLHRRERLATGANLFFATSVALAVASGTLLYVFRRDTFVD